MADPLDIEQLLDMAASAAPPIEPVAEPIVLRHEASAPARPSFTTAWHTTFVELPVGPHRRGDAASGEPTEAGAGDVHLLTPVWLATRPVTQSDWHRLMPDQPSRWNDGFEAGLRPVERITWDDALAFIDALNDELDELASASEHASHPSPPFGGHYRLPSEAEWEAACRAGTTTRWSFGDEVSDGLAEHAWYAPTSGARPQPCGLRTANAWGFTDLHGLVQEWCADVWCPDHRGAAADGRARTATDAGADATRRVVRGGSWLSEAEATRSAARRGLPRDRRSDTVGMRLAWQPAESSHAGQDA